MELLQHVGGLLCSRCLTCISVTMHSSYYCYWSAVFVKVYSFNIGENKASECQLGIYKYPCPFSVMPSKMGISAGTDTEFRVKMNIKVNTWPWNKRCCPGICPSHKIGTETSSLELTALVLYATWRRRPLDMKGSCEYVEKAVADSR
jgi:hypothetical protein